MILGLAGILFGLLTGLPGAIMGMIGLKNVKNGEADNKGQALTGLIAGILTSLGSLIAGIIVIILLAAGAIGAGSGTTEPTSPQTQGGQEPGGDNGGQEPGGDNGGQEPGGDNGGQEPGGNGGQEPGGSGGGNNGGSSGGNSSGKSPEIENGVNLGVRSKQTTAGKYANPTEVQNKEYMFIEVVITNNSDSEYSLPYPLISAELNGKQLERVTDVETQKKGPLDWPSSLAPGEEAVYQTGFVASGSDAKNVKVTVSLNGKKFDFTNG